jgi:hypothetical protein
MPFTPHLNTAHFEVDCPEVPNEDWIDGDIAILRLLPRARAAVLLLPGWEQSKGARLERDWAIHLNLEVFDPPATPVGDPARRGVQEAVPVTFFPAGEARLDLYTDALILDIGRDTFVVPLARLADLTAHRRREVVVSRRYWGDAPGTFRDVEQGLRLRRSQTDRSLMLTEQGRVYSMPIRAVHDVREGREESCVISMLVTDARQLDDAHSRQTVLEVRA